MNKLGRPVTVGVSMAETFHKQNPLVAAVAQGFLECLYKDNHVCGGLAKGFALRGGSEVAAPEVQESFERTTGNNMKQLLFSQASLYNRS
eukprot:6884320-Pyramimonas_sp.AAC.1